MKGSSKLVHSFISPYIQSINQSMPKMSAPGLKDCLIFSYISNTRMSVGWFIHPTTMCCLPGLCQTLYQTLLYASLSGRHLPVLPLGSYSVLNHKWTNTFIITRCGFDKCCKGNAHVGGINSKSWLELDTIYAQARRMRHGCSEGIFTF